VAIAVSEVVTNAVIHAYPAGVDRRVRLVDTLQPDSLVITVADRGRG
jgi:anti-sigma regulatory factor (Ser/Thr protein kinase)